MIGGISLVYWYDFQTIIESDQRAFKHRCTA